MAKILTLLLFILFQISVSGCSREPETGSGEVRWDREICERCKMAVSDHYYSAQIRGGSAGKKTRLYKFDDVGCAVIWLDEQPWKDDPRTEVWVTDFRNGDWIDAKKAAYVKGKKTPMDYGLGAQPTPVEGALNYEQAKAHIYEVEKSDKRHGMHKHKMNESMQ
ncbi:MAG TPA: hypothetical protein EYH06_00530 [Chromatiales bacterium]|nr:hypothetical protein [Thiotrichales bacterium]HIP67057.1 hypothetical protein [Chromatiales bacterium]